MRTRIPAILLLGVAALAAASARPAAAWSLPSLDVAVGKAHPGPGTPYEGGMSFAISPLWPAGDHAQFGVSFMADDMGATLIDLYDLNDGVALGTVATNHGTTWAAAWRGDVDLLRRPKWVVGATGNIGYWRVADDIRGARTGTASDVGLGLGLSARRRFAHTHEYGVVVRAQRLFDQRNAAYRRAGSYSTVALEWRWLAPVRD
jgi:hypothetical protein